MEEEEEAALMGVQEMVEREGEEQLVEVPVAFIRPVHERPTQAHAQQLPIIDVSGLLCPLTRPQILLDIVHACADWGFFQAINHGVRDEVVEEMRKACLRFFNQPAHERNKFRCNNYENPVIYTTSFNSAKGAARDWKDVLYVRDVRGVCNGFDVAPEICREACKAYKRGLDKLSNVLYEAIFESLGLSLAYVKEALPALGRLVIGVNYYPPCPDPSLTYGISGHSDIGTLTILLQDEVPGLQIKKGDDWFSVPPLPNAFVVNLADQIEILSNGKFKSIEHRALTNAKKTRMSIASFYGPDDDAIISPLPDFVSVSEPALYKEVKYKDYVKNFFSKSLLSDKDSLNLAK